LLRQDLVTYEKRMPESWERFRCQSLLGAVLSAQHKYSEAEPLLLDGVQGMLQRESTIPWFGKSDPDRALEYVVRLYDAWGKCDKGAEWRSKLQARKARATAPQA
jgi:eukaryotic-like serine/threonine-protein kinase